MFILVEAPKVVEKPKKVKIATPPPVEEEKIVEEAPKEKEIVNNKKVETVVGTKSEFRDPDMVVTATDAAQIESTSLVVNKKRTQAVDEPQSNVVNFKVFIGIVFLLIYRNFERIGQHIIILKIEIL